MADILQDFPIHAPPARVFEAITQPAGLDQWWTIRSTGQPAMGSIYELDFGPDYLWRAVVTRCVPDATFELRITDADRDWTDTLVGFDLSPSASGTMSGSLIGAGPKRTGTIGHLVTAGRCIFASSAAIWSSAKRCRTTSGWTFDIRHRREAHENP